MAQVREERPGDGADIRAVHIAGFPTSLEANLVEQLKADGDSIISLVAESDHELVGHVLFSRMDVEADGLPVHALGLAPVAVIPSRQRTGVGSSLIETGLGIAQARGAEIVFVLGEPEYYARFGFSTRTAEPFESRYAGPFFQAKALRSAFTPPSCGRADYAPAFAGLE
jgi:putative acetyltransferase